MIGANAYYLITHHGAHVVLKLCTPASLIELKPYNVRAQPTSTIIHSRYILVNFVVRLIPVDFPHPLPDPPFGAEGGMASLAPR